jgi:plastocyanin
MEECPEPQPIPANAARRPNQEERTMKRALSMVLAGLTVLAIALPARAATSTVDMTQQLTFDPTPSAINLGDSVKWVNTSSGFDHTATSNTGFFDTGSVAPGGSKTKVFQFAGSFPYYCQFHGSPTFGMRGKVNVPDRWLNTGTQHVGHVQRIRVSTVAPPAGLAFDVQMKGPGDGAFSAFKTKFKHAIVKFTPTKAGEYLFRSRVHRLSNNKASGFSPAVAVEISP